jgi:hypothetical protein
LSNHIQYIVKTQLENGFTQVDFITFEGEGTAGGTTTYTEIYPDEIAALITPKGTLPN